MVSISMSLSLQSYILYPVSDNVYSTRCVAIHYFNGRYYISAYTDLIVLQHCAHRHKNAFAFTGAIISTMWV